MEPSTESLPGAAGRGATAGAALLAVLVLVVYWPIVGFDFVELDDPLNFVRNTGYRGLGSEQLAWMFLSLHGFSAYDPIMWLTFGVDYTLYGLDPARFHATNLLLYTTTSLAFFRLCSLALVRVRRLRDGRASVRAPTTSELLAALAMTALLFVHPLRAETVAWLSERHGVLAALFSILSVTAYLRYTARRQRGEAHIGAYGASLAWFTLAILSKSTVLFLPLCLFVLDFHPLRRLAAGPPPLRERLMQCVGEKLPFLALSWPIGLVTVLARRSDGLWTGVETQPIAERLLQSAWGSAFYLYKTLVPSGLGPIYLRLEYRELYGVWFYVAAAGFAVVCMLAIALRHRLPALLSGLALYGLLLLPIVGVFQSGPLVAADRYSFIALMPLHVALAFPLARALSAGRAGTAVLALLVLLIGTSAALARIQTSHWRDADALWRHTIAQSALPGLMHFNRAALLRQIEDHEGAIRELRTAHALRPEDADVLALWAQCASEAGRPDEAVGLYRRTLALDPKRYEAYVGLGGALHQVGDVRGARGAYSVAFDFDPERFEAPTALAEMYIEIGDTTSALDLLDGVLGRDPSRLIARWLRARVRASLGDRLGAVEDLALIVQQGRSGDAAAQSLAAAAQRALAEFERQRSADAPGVGQP